MHEGLVAQEVWLCIVRVRVRVWGTLVRVRVWVTLLASTSSE